MTILNIAAIRERLLDLAQDRQSFFNDDGDDEVFRDDYDALVKAAALMAEVERLKDALGWILLSLLKPDRRDAILDTEDKNVVIADNEVGNIMS